MKTRLLIVVALIVSVTTMAQKPVRETRSTNSSPLERMKRDLALSESQYASIKGIESKYGKQRDAERKKYQLMRLEERKTIQSLRMERELQIRKVLSPEQTKKLNEQKMARQKYREHKMEKRKGDFRGGRYGHKHQHSRHRHR